MNMWGHFKTITQHRHMVIRHCFKAGIGFQGLRHDLSKYSPAEFIPGARYYVGYRSPNDIERGKFGYSSAWLHHKGRNKHHFEYWNDCNPKTGLDEPVKMPLKYVAEMFCDRVAAGKIYLKDKYTNSNPIDYFQKNNYARSRMHPDTACLLEEWLCMIRDKGEDETFSHIRQYLKTHKDY